MGKELGRNKVLQQQLSVCKKAGAGELMHFC